MRPSRVKRGYLKRYKYTPKNLGWRSGDIDIINYGRSFGDRRIKKKLSQMANLLTHDLLEFADALTPSKALEYILEGQEKAHCEITWVRDYQEHLKG